MTDTIAVPAPGDGWRQIGTVEIHRARVYLLDPQAAGTTLATDVVVAPGVYPIYRRDDVIQWLMTGRVSDRNQKIGDGLFVIGGGDKPTGLPVQFPSLAFGVEAFAEMSRDADICERMTFTLTEPITTGEQS